MNLSASEKVIMDRFLEKSRIAGGARPGYMLRKASILYIQEEHPGVDFEDGLSSLLARDLLKANEGGNLYYLTASGAEVLTEL